MQSIELISRVIIRQGGKVLLCKNKERGNYYLPGGHVEFGDTIEKTVYKELDEELGLREDQILNLKYLDILENLFGEEEDLHHEVNFIFTADLAEGTEAVSKEDHIDFEWKEIDDLETIGFRPIGMIPLIKRAG